VGWPSCDCLFVPRLGLFNLETPPTGLTQASLFVRGYWPDPAEPYAPLLMADAPGGGPSKWAMRKEAKRQMYALSTEKAPTIRPLGARGKSRAPATYQCQKCLAYGHYTYECKDMPVYAKRPSRSELIRDPSLYPSYTLDVPPPELPNATKQIQAEVAKWREAHERKKRKEQRKMKKESRKRKHESSDSSSDSSESESSSDEEDSSSDSSDDSSSTDSSASSSDTDTSSESEEDSSGNDHRRRRSRKASRQSKDESKKDERRDEGREQENGSSRASPKNETALRRERDSPSHSNREEKRKREERQHLSDKRSSRSHDSRDERGHDGHRRHHRRDDKDVDGASEDHHHHHHRRRRHGEEDNQRQKDDSRRRDHD